MRIYMVEDETLTRTGQRLLLSGLEKDIDFEEAGDCETVVNFANKDTVDLLLLDLYLPGVDGVDALVKIRECYTCPIVVLSSEDNPQIIRQALACGADGFIPKSSTSEVMIAALKLVLAKGVYLPPHVLDSLHDKDVINSMGNNSNIKGRDNNVTPKTRTQKTSTHETSTVKNHRLGELSERQLDVLRKAAQGKVNKVIAKELYISEGTVKAHLSACYRVLEVSNRTEAGIAAVSLGLVSELEEI